MPAGDISSVVIRADGWSADITVLGVGTGGTYDTGLGANNDPTNAKIVLTVTSLGYDDTGAAATVTRTVYGTKTVRKAYPNEATLDETVSGSDVVIRVALSEYIHTKDKAGSGNSGTDVTYSVAAGWYTKTGVPNNAGTGTATNNSTQGYAKVVANWSWPGWNRVTGNFDLRCVAFHRGGQQGRPVRAVKFTVTDEHSHTVTTTVTTPTCDTNFGDAVPVVEYVGTIDVSTFTDKDQLTCNFVAYPWVGDLPIDTADAVNTSPTPLYCPIYQLLDKGGTYGVTVAVVDTAGNDSTGAVVSTDDPATAASTPYLTIGKAAAAIAAYNNSNRSRNDVGGGIIYVKAGNFNWLGSSNTYGNVPKCWITIKPYTSVARSAVVINGQSGDYNISHMVKLDNVTFASNATFTFYILNRLWLHNCDVSSPTGLAPFYVDLKVCYLTQCAIGNVDQGLRSYSTENVAHAIVRGCTLDGFKKNIMPYTFLGNKNTTKNVYGFQLATGGQTAPSTDGCIIAYNDLRNNNTSGNAILLSDGNQTSVRGRALVQNVIECVSAAFTGAAIAIDADSTTSDSDNWLIWHNVVTGERSNLAYNSTGSAAVYRRNWSVKNNILDVMAIKSDTFTGDGGANGARVGNWASLYGCGWSGNVEAETINIPAAGSFPPDFGGVKLVRPSGTGTTATGYVGFVSRNSWDGGGTDGAGNGDYHTAQSSPAAGLDSSLVLSHDLSGKARQAGNSAGAYILPASLPLLRTLSFKHLLTR